MDNEIILHVDNEWPIIISGGDDADKYSLYLMADLSMRAGRLDYYFYWITLSASKNFGPAQKSLALNFLAEQQFDQAMYWFTRLALSENEEFSRTVIAQYLFEANNENSDPFLAENLLVDLVKDGAYDALYYLGYLHLQNLPNWNNNPSLAIRYLEESCGRCNDKVAMQRLANCYRNGNSEQNHSHGARRHGLASSGWLRHVPQAGRTSYGGGDRDDEDREAEAGGGRTPSQDRFPCASPEGERGLHSHNGLPLAAEGDGAEPFRYRGPVHYEAGFKILYSGGSFQEPPQC